jgi:pimeloyl-ACP methyl ester carboxylesterase
MPYATNRLDRTRVYFEDDAGGGAAVVLHGGLLDSVDDVRESKLAQALPPDEFRLIYVDHRGLGRSQKPHDSKAYAVSFRAADAVAVLDQLAIERAHFIGISWGGRLGFAIGEHKPERVLSLVIGGQQPYAWPDSPLTRVVTAGHAASQTEGMEAPVRAFESFRDVRCSGPPAVALARQRSRGGSGGGEHSTGGRRGRRGPSGVADSMPDLHRRRRCRLPRSGPSCGGRDPERRDHRAR